MVTCPDQLVWEIVKKNSCFLKKKNGNSKRSGKIAFSAEKLNLKSLSQLKYSGLANTKVVDIIATPDHRTNLIVKTASKASAYPSKTHAVTNVRKDFRRSVATLKKMTVANYYRPDLNEAILAKFTKVYQANRRARGLTKLVPTKKGRTTLEK